VPAKDLWRGSEASPVVLLDGLGPRLGFRALSHTLLHSHWNCWLSWRLRVGNGHGVPTRLSWRAPPHLIWPSRSRHVASTWPPHLAQGRHVASVQRSRWPITFREPSTLTMQVRHRSVISRSRLCGEKAKVSDFCAITVTGPPNSHAHGGASRMCDSCLMCTVKASCVNVNTGKMTPGGVGTRTGRTDRQTSNLTQPVLRHCYLCAEIRGRFTAKGS
jgi:hypothetical protein